MFQVISIVLLVTRVNLAVPRGLPEFSELLLGCSEGVAMQLKILFQFSYFRVSHLKF